MTDNLDELVDTAMNALTFAMWISGTEPHEIEDAISAWRAKVIDNGTEEVVAEVMADVVTDAIRQAVEHREGRRSVRVLPERGQRLTFSWLPEDGQPDEHFARMVEQAVKSCLEAAS